MPLKKTPKVLIINICKERLHYLEFVKPIEDILKKNNIEFYAKHYSKFTDKDLTDSNKIIICGTSLKDKDYLININKFKWLDFYNKPILGICAGMQILVKHFNGGLIENQEIGLKEINFEKEFLNINSNLKVYQLHNLITLPSDEFEIIATSSNEQIIQVIKHKEKPFYGVLFHPEVRNKKLILEFCYNSDN